MRARKRAQSLRGLSGFALEHLEKRELLAADLMDVTVLGPTDEAVVASSVDTSTSMSAMSVVSRRSILPVVRPLSSEVRSVDGVGNNRENPEFGAAGETYIRVAAADYADGIADMAGEERPSAREISNALAAQQVDVSGNERQLSAFVYLWGQFLDHDITLTESDGTEEAFIEVPTDDPFFDPEGTGSQFIAFFRSVFDGSTGTDVDNPREQYNAITAFIDGSQVYGSDQATADSLRTLEGGKLLTSEGDLLPLGSDGYFLAGDVRANENIELTAMQTLFLREHNWWADHIAKQNSSRTDAEIYQQARAIVIAEIQAITFEEFLPALLGEGVMPEYEGYDPAVNPGIANEFSTAAFRLGHSLLNDDVEFFGNDGRAIFEEVELSDAFFNPQLILEHGIDSILKYAASSQSQELDNQLVDSVRNFLFGEPGQGGLDLASLNIQRGRDHGLADYNSVREAYGLPRVSSFAEITSNIELQQTLADLCDTVDDLDLWVGALAEDHVHGGSVGELVQTIIADQFNRLRAGDRFWYENNFSAQDVRQLRRTTLSDVIRRNTAVTNLQDNVFFMSATVSGTVLADNTGTALRRHRNPGLAGVTVDLLNDEGEVVDTTVTDSRGFYLFDTFLETGDYQVRVLRPGSNTTVVAETADVLISRGGLDVSDVSFPAVAARPARHTRQRLAATDVVAFDVALGSSTSASSIDILAAQLAARRRRPA